VRWCPKTDERGVIRSRQSLHGLPRRGLRARPPVAIAHAVRAIEEDDDLARVLRRSPSAAIGRSEERPREREDDQQDGASRIASSGQSRMRRRRTD
jgi:hypothetical protein